MHMAIRRLTAQPAAMSLKVESQQALNGAVAMAKGSCTRCKRSSKMMASSVDFGTGTAARVAAVTAATTPMLLHGCGRQFLPVAAHCHCAADVP